MGVLDSFRRRSDIPANATFRLTEEGREKLQEFRSDSRSRVLQALETRGSCGSDEISHASHLSRGQVERLLPSLLRSGYVVMRGGMGERDVDDG